MIHRSLIKQLQKYPASAEIHQYVLRTRPSVYLLHHDLPLAVAKRFLMMYPACQACQWQAPRGGTVVLRFLGLNQTHELSAQARKIPSSQVKAFLCCSVSWGVSEDERDPDEYFRMISVARQFGSNTKMKYLETLAIYIPRGSRFWGLTIFSLAFGCIDLRLCNHSSRQ